MLFPLYLYLGPNIAIILAIFSFLVVLVVLVLFIIIVSIFVSIIVTTNFLSFIIVDVDTKNHLALFDLKWNMIDNIIFTLSNLMKRVVTFKIVLAITIFFSIYEYSFINLYLNMKNRKLFNRPLIYLFLTYTKMLQR